MNGAEDDEGAARGDAGGVRRGDVGGGGDHQGAPSPEALDPRLIRRNRDDRDDRDGERDNQEKVDEKARRTGKERSREKDVGEEEIDRDAPQADHQAALAPPRRRLTPPL